MHYRLLLAVKAATKEDAKKQVTEFLEPYGNGSEWDWYEIGGRWDEYGEIVSHKEKGFEQLREEVNRMCHRNIEEHAFLVEILENGVDSVKSQKQQVGFYYRQKKSYTIQQKRENGMPL